MAVKTLRTWFWGPMVSASWRTRHTPFSNENLKKKIQKNFAIFFETEIGQPRPKSKIFEISGNESLTPKYHFNASFRSKKSKLAKLETQTFS